MDPEQFRKDKEIDPNQLDIECVTLAELSFKWAKASIESDIEEERAKFKMSLVEGRLEQECRRNPAEFGLPKVTDPGVKAAVRIHPDYIQAFEDWLTVRRRSKLLTAAAKTMDDKKRMLDGLIKLHGQQYFAGPNVPRDLVSEWKEYLDRGENQVNAAQRKRKRRRSS